ncbi:Na+/H+ antiporter subunit E [Oscillibacter sp.]|uniref:Na+/H+ antiporter subunit E n=1 Tax=Oscillibacter sp. TaxID=1945593 RepID=UPI0028A2340A|nr:Na+/H+ antiporter subunit E [Oscillibacter sp.]
MLILLFGLWIFLSGELDLEVCIIGGAVSAGLYLLACKTLGYSPREDWAALKKTGSAIRYLGYLVKEMLLAGLVVMRLIYTKGRNMDPRLIWFRTDLTHQSARAALSDAITLTAGTIVVSQEGNLLCVHTLDASLAEGLEHGEFERKLLGLEKNV